MERILVVDDDRGMQDVLDIMLSRAGYKVATADDGAAALDIIGKKKFDLVITDLKRPRVDGSVDRRRVRRHVLGRLELTRGGGQDRHQARPARHQNPMRTVTPL